MAWYSNIVSVAKVLWSDESVRKDIQDIVAHIFGDTVAKKDSRPLKIMNALEIRAKVIAMNLLRPEWFDTMTDAEWIACWNGYGPDSWPAWMRSAVTWVYRFQEIVAAPHDCWFWRSDGTRETWRRVMDEWIANARTNLNARFPMWKVWLWAQRADEWTKMKVAIIALEEGSFDAWVSAHKRECLPKRRQFRPFL